MIKNFAFALVGALALGMGAAAFAQSTAPVVPLPGETHRPSDSMESDRPASPVRIVIPAPQAPGPGALPGTGIDDEDREGPPEEIRDEPPEEIDDTPTFFGEPVRGKFIWVLDRSGSMMASDSGSGPIEDANGNITTNPSRIAIVKSECIRGLNQLSEDDEFAIVTFGSSPDVTWYESLVPANTGNKQQGVAFVQAMVASGMTPAFAALNRACSQYPSELDKFYFLCDGGPNVTGTAAEILAAFPGWYQHMRDAGCELVCVHIGTSGAAAQFMQALANQNGGTYIHK